MTVCGVGGSAVTGPVFTARSLIAPWSRTAWCPPRPLSPLHSRGSASKSRGRGIQSRDAMRGCAQWALGVNSRGSLRPCEALAGPDPCMPLGCYGPARLRLHSPRALRPCLYLRRWHRDGRRGGMCKGGVSRETRSQHVRSLLLQLLLHATAVEKAACS